MADLTEKEASQSVKIVGANVDGSETNFAEVDNVGRVKVGFDAGTLDTFGHLLTTSRSIHVDVQFISGVVEDKVFVDQKIGSVSTQVTQGHAILSSGTDTTAVLRLTSMNKVKYEPGHELFMFATAAFTTPTHANSYQRLGLYDGKNGFHIGFEGTTFGVSVLKGGSRTTVAQASFNCDTLTGASTSKFTRGGVPEALDITKVNVFRIRFGWLGSAPASFEIQAPDGHWVTFHKIFQPNSSSTPIIENPELPVRCSIMKYGADATDLVVLTSCWVAGSNYFENAAESMERRFTTSSPLNVAHPLEWHLQQIDVLEKIRKELTLIRFNLNIITGNQGLSPDETDDLGDI